MENRLFELALFCPPLFYKTKYSKQNSSPLPEFFIFIFRKVKKLTTKVDLSQYLGHILVETVKPFFLLLILQIPVGLDSESSYGFDFGY
ncbi:hypothetical protein KQG34_13115, partial [Enterococcus faecium]|nr:hypothetical protein [Enterococcus faecium]